MVFDLNFFSKDILLFLLLLRQEIDDLLVSCFPLSLFIVIVSVYAVLSLV